MLIPGVNRAVSCFVKQPLLTLNQFAKCCRHSIITTLRIFFLNIQIRSGR